MTPEPANGPRIALISDLSASSSKKLNAKEQVFDFAGKRVSIAELGVAMAEAAWEHKKFVEIGNVRVTTNYILLMLSFAGKEKWFSDALTESGQDHQFDDNEPTPGSCWDEVKKLRKRIHEEYAAATRASGHLRGFLRNDLYRQHTANAKRLTQEVNELARKL